MKDGWTSDYFFGHFLGIWKRRSGKCRSLIHLDDTGISFWKCSKEACDQFGKWWSPGLLVCDSLSAPCPQGGATCPSNQCSGAALTVLSSALIVTLNLWLSVLLQAESSYLLQVKMKRNSEAPFFLPVGQSHPLRCWQWLGTCLWRCTESGISANILLQPRDGSCPWNKGWKWPIKSLKAIFFQFQFNSTHTYWEPTMCCVLSRVVSPDTNVARWIGRAVLPPSPGCLLVWQRMLRSHLGHRVRPWGQRCWQRLKQMARVVLCRVRKWEECTFCSWEGDSEKPGRWGSRVMRETRPLCRARRIPSAEVSQDF